MRKGPQIQPCSLIYTFKNTKTINECQKLIFSNKHCLANACLPFVPKSWAATARAYCGRLPVLPLLVAAHHAISSANALKTNTLLKNFNEMSALTSPPQKTVFKSALDQHGQFFGETRLELWHILPVFRRMEDVPHRE